MTVLVVGAGPGMGRAIAARLGRDHGPVALIARRRASLDRMTAELAAVGVRAVGLAADITDDEALERAVVSGREQLGRYDVVVFNASLFVAGPVTETDPAQFRAGLATGITAALVTVRATVDDLRAAAPAAALLFTGGGLAFTPWPDGIGLAIQKAGLRHLALAAATELRPQGVSVSIVTIRGTIAPGGPFDPDRIAATYADLARHGTQRPVEVTVDDTGADWSIS